MYCFCGMNREDNANHSYIQRVDWVGSEHAPLSLQPMSGTFKN